MAGAMKGLALAYLERSASLLQCVLNDEPLVSTLIGVADLTARALLNERKLMVAGNGGSAADAQHLVAEFVSRLTIDRPALRAVALTTDSSILTAIGNDYGYDRIFERQLEALGQAGDLFLGITTSGNSPNIVKGLMKAKSMGITSMVLTGGTGGQVVALADHSLIVPSSVTSHIQEGHLVLEHLFCTLVERFYFGPDLFADNRETGSVSRAPIEKELVL